MVCALLRAELSVSVFDVFAVILREPSRVGDTPDVNTCTTLPTCSFVFHILVASTNNDVVGAFAIVGDAVDEGHA
ncbi:MAG: hypothetical protein ACK55I_50110, partial [bacterium]